MTLDRLSERITEAKNKEGKTDGRRFNSRSQMKMKWEIRGIIRVQNKQKKRSTAGLYRGIYTKEEMEESRLEQEENKKENVKKELVEVKKELVEGKKELVEVKKESGDVVKEEPMMEVNGELVN